MAGLVRQPARIAGDDAAIAAPFHPGSLQPARHAGRETEGDDHYVGLDQCLAAGQCLGTAAAIGIGRAECGFDHGHADHLVIGAGLDRQRLAVEQETHAFLARIGDLARRAGHRGLVAAVGAGDPGRTQTDRAAHAVHAGIAAAEHQHALADDIGQGRLVFPAGNRAPGRVSTGDDAAVVDQERQGRYHPLQFLPGQAAVGVAVGAGAGEDRIEIGQQAVDADIAADFHAEAELHAHAFEQCTAAGDHVLVQLEVRDAVLEQAADLFVAVKHHGLHAGPGQAVGTGQPGRAGADHRHPLAGLRYMVQIRGPAGGQGGIDDVFLHRADGHRAEFLQRAAALAQAVLRADPAADLGQRVGAVAQGGRLVDAVLLHQLQPLRDGVVHRAFPRAVRVAAVQAAAGLVLRLGLVEALVQLAPIAGDTCLDGNACGHLARQVQELEGLLAAHVGSPGTVGEGVARSGRGNGSRRGVFMRPAAGNQPAIRCWPPSV